MNYPAAGDGMVSILEPAYPEGECPREESVGSCERGGWEDVYYQDSNQWPMGGGFGCYFAGDWIAP